MPTRSGRRLSGLRLLGIGACQLIAATLGLEMLLSQPTAARLAHNATVSCLGRCRRLWAGCSSNNSLIGASAMADQQPRVRSSLLRRLHPRDRSFITVPRYGWYLWPPATSATRQRPSAPVPPFSLRRRRLTMRASPLWSPPPLKQQTGSGATAKKPKRKRAA